MSIIVDSSAFTPVAQTQLVSLGAEQNEITALTGVSPDAGSPFGPAATLTLSPAAQSLLDGQVSGMQLQSLESADGIDASTVAQLATETASPDSADYDPANPFGDASSSDTEFDPADPFAGTSSETTIAQAEFDPADPFAGTSS